MALVNEFGQPFAVSTHFAHAADRSRVRGVQYWTRSTSIEKLIPPMDRQTLVYLSQRLYTNKGVVRACIDATALTDVSPDGTRTPGLREVSDYTAEEVLDTGPPEWRILRVTGEVDPEARSC